VKIKFWIKLQHSNTTFRPEHGATRCVGNISTLFFENKMTIQFFIGMTIIFVGVYLYSNSPKCFEGQFFSRSWTKPHKTTIVVRALILAATLLSVNILRSSLVMFGESEHLDQVDFQQGFLPISTKSTREQQKVDVEYVLNKTVMEVWGDVASVDAFKNVFGKLPVIYKLILSNGGGNDLVETNRGKKGVEEASGDTSQEDNDNANTGPSLEDYVDYAQGLVDDEVVDDDGEEDDDFLEQVI
jgi:hypothetical protein